MTDRDRILVTGATGFLGNALCHALKQKGYFPIALGRQADKLAALKAAQIETVQADLAQADPAVLAKQIGKIGMIVHAAALSSPWGRQQEFELANVTATENVIRMARLADARRIVLVSSPTVYFRFEDQWNVVESSPLPTPVNVYAATKRRAEELVGKCAIPSKIILRPRGIYGKGDTSLLPRLLRAAQSGPLPLVRDGIAQTDITHVSDVVSAIIHALEYDGGEGARFFNISSGEANRLTEIISRACELNNITPRWRKVPASLLVNASRLLEQVYKRLPGYPEPRITAYSAGLLAYSQTLDISAARTELGWQPKVGFTEGLRKTFGDHQ